MTPSKLPIGDGNCCRLRSGHGLRRWQAVLLLSWFVAAAGCGNADSKRGTVQGTVTVNGKPPAAGAIAFTPVSGAAPTAGGKIVDGKYSAEVPIGLAKVAIRVSKIVGQRKLYDSPDSPVQPLMEESLPPEFNDRTELTLDVKPGVNEHVFHLKAK
jgi:hypothetical protein